MTNDERYAELLALLVRKGFGPTVIKHMPSGGAKRTTVRDELAAEEERLRNGTGTRGDFGCESQDGRLAIFAEPVNGEKPLVLWLEP